ncbi:hypothetical protein GGI43DRAFT_208924 [Trichoderma evansii]
MNQQGYNDEEAEDDFTETGNGRILVTCNDMRAHFTNQRTTQTIARLELAVDPLQANDSQRSDECKSLRDINDSLRRENQRKQWEINKLQDGMFDVNNKCEHLQQKIRMLERNDRGFRVAINKLQTTVKTHGSFISETEKLFKEISDYVKRKKTAATAIEA